MRWQILFVIQTVIAIWVEDGVNGFSPHVFISSFIAVCSGSITYTHLKQMKYRFFRVTRTLTRTRAPPPSRWSHARIRPLSRQPLTASTCARGLSSRTTKSPTSLGKIAPQSRNDVRAASVNGRVCVCVCMTPRPRLAISRLCAVGRWLTAYQLGRQELPEN